MINPYPGAGPPCGCPPLWDQLGPESYIAFCPHREAYGETATAAMLSWWTQETSLDQARPDR